MTAEQLRTSFAEQIATERAAIERHSQVVETLRRHEGKKITKRLNKDLEKIGARLSFRYGMIYVTFQSKGSMDTFDHLLAYDNDPTVNLTKFEEWDASQGRAAIERNQSRETYLHTSKPEQAVQALADFQAAAKAFQVALAINGTHEVAEAAKQTLKELFYWRIS